MCIYFQFLLSKNVSIDIFSWKTLSIYVFNYVHFQRSWCILITLKALHQFTCLHEVYKMVYFSGFLSLVNLKKNQFPRQNLCNWWLFKFTLHWLLMKLNVSPQCLLYFIVIVLSSILNFWVLSILSRVATTEYMKKC